jgi:hypothetical protein
VVEQKTVVEDRDLLLSRAVGTASGGSQAAEGTDSVGLEVDRGSPEVDHGEDSPLVVAVDLEVEEVHHGGGRRVPVVVAAVDEERMLDHHRDLVGHAGIHDAGQGCRAAFVVEVRDPGALACRSCA